MSDDPIYFRHATTMFLQIEDKGGYEDNDNGRRWIIGMELMGDGNEVVGYEVCYDHFCEFEAGNNLSTAQVYKTSDLIWPDDE